MSMARTGPLAGALAVALLSGALATPAQAHPHVWITYETTVIYEKGTFVGVRHKWSFDEFYTAMAICAKRVLHSLAASAPYVS